MKVEKLKVMTESLINPSIGSVPKSAVHLKSENKLIVFENMPSKIRILGTEKMTIF